MIRLNIFNLNSIVDMSRKTHRSKSYRRRHRQTRKHGGACPCSIGGGKKRTLANRQAGKVAKANTHAKRHGMRLNAPEYEPSQNILNKIALNKDFNELMREVNKKRRNNMDDNNNFNNNKYNYN